MHEKRQNGGTNHLSIGEMIEARQKNPRERKRGNKHLYAVGEANLICGVINSNLKRGRRREL